MDLLSWIQNTTNFSNLSSGCSGGPEWIENAFGQCIETPLQWASFIIGLTSILCWLCAQAPQVITNYRTGKADEALSFWFLLIWVVGDVTNLVGAILTHQVASQTVTAGYFVLMDCVLMGQWLYYTIKNKGVKGLLLPCAQCTKACQKKKKSYAVIPTIIAPLAFTGLAGVSMVSIAHFQLQYSKSEMGFRSRSLMSTTTDPPVVNVNNLEDVIGYVIGCVSGFLYVVSRLPQIFKNFRRRSVEGLSILLFFFAVMGNVTYSLGIFLYYDAGWFLLQKLPWIVGSIGTLMLDFTIFVQFWVFGTKEDFKRSLCDCGCQQQKGEDTEPLLNHTDKDTS